MERETDERFMARALELAEHGLGGVEPNPLVGCVLVADGRIVGEGWHRRYGGDHAEVDALRSTPGELVRGATAYVTLEPCSHFGKTPPCADALIRAGVRRVVAAMLDPFPAVAGRGLQRLRDAGLDVSCGTLEAQARELNAPYLRLVLDGRPWVIAKWASSLDGKIATATGESQWISGPESRAVVHTLRGRVDGVLVGSGTALADDPQLTARPAGPRTATRVVLDRRATLRLDSQLVRTAREIPVLIVACDSGEAAQATQERIAALERAGCEVLRFADEGHSAIWTALLRELGRRRWTNLLVEGGAEVLGTLVETRLVDEVHVFLAPKILGGRTAPSAVGGSGIARLASALKLRSVRTESCGIDIHVSGRVARESE